MKPGAIPWLPLLSRRLLVLPLLVVAATSLTHILVELAPGDYFSQFSDNPHLSPETLAALRAEHGLDQDALSRYLRWLWSALHLDFGLAYDLNLPVSTVLASRLSATLLLTGSALLVAWGLTLPLGVLAAAREGRLIDRLIGAFTLVGLSTPRVFLSLLALLFAATTGLFPTGGLKSVRWDELSAAGRALDVAHHLALPVLVLGLTQSASLIRQLRAAMREALSQPFIQTARAKGLSHKRIFWRHAFPNALNPLLTLFGFSLAGLLSGSFVVEVIFAWPGLGRLAVEAALTQNEPVVLAVVTVGTVMLVLGSLVADLALMALDPRVRAGVTR